jgi:eukaryotic-like serine/threonine-protein kinase
VAYSARREGQSISHIYLQVADAGAAPVQLTDAAASDIWPTWSPDGRWIAFLRTLPDKRRQTIRRSPVGAGETVMVEGDCASLAWTPDSRSIVCAGGAGGRPGLRMFSSDGSDERALTDPPGGVMDLFPAVARGGRQLAFVRLNPAGPSYEIYELTLDNAGVVGAPRLIRKSARFVGYLTWSGPRELLLTAVDEVGATRIARLRTDQESAALVWLDLPDGNLYRPVISGAGDRLVYSQSTDQFEVRRARPGVDERHPAGSNRGELIGRFSPDGSRVALLSARSGQWDMWLADADGREAIRLTTLGGIEYFNWAPDGAFLVLERRETSALTAIYSVPITGGAPRRLTDGKYRDTSPSVSRDGRRIYFSSDRSAQREVYRMTIDGGNIEVVTAGGGDLPLETYDGQHLVFVRRAANFRGVGPLWVVPVAGGAERRLPVSSGGNFTVGREGIYVVPPKDSLVSVCDPVTGAVRTIPNLSAGIALSSVSPDGLTVLHTTQRAGQSDLMMVDRFR